MSRRKAPALHEVTEYDMDSAHQRGAARPTAPRLSPVSPVTPDLEEIIAGGLKSVDGEPLRIFGTMGHHPKLLKRFLSFGGFFLNRGLIPEREREIVILRVGWNTRSIYEFGQHTVIGRNCGLSDAEINAIARDESDHPWSRRDRGLIAMADDICADDCVGDPTWQELRADWSNAELCELVLLVGMYRMVAGFLNTMGVELDPNTPGWPDPAGR
jgi:alkylhydroperoxidase family enzyme